MASTFFTTNFILFGILTAGSTLAQTYLKRKAGVEDGNGASVSGQPAQSGSARSLWRSYIVVYALVMGKFLLVFSFTYLRSRHAAADTGSSLIFSQVRIGYKVGGFHYKLEDAC
jgi:hypothetical protein